MSVYVDDMRAGYGSMTMCHMAADTREELLAMADRIGVQRRWLQCPGTWKEHFDVCLSKRKLAVKIGAVEVSQRDFVAKVQGPKREAERGAEKYYRLSTPREAAAHDR